MASTHGDHSINVTCVRTGKHIRHLEGHPRTPWCIAFHPTSPDILASGCLAGQVRVWDLHVSYNMFLFKSNRKLPQSYSMEWIIIASIT